MNVRGALLIITVFCSIISVLSARGAEVPAAQRTGRGSQSCRDCTTLPPTFTRIGPPADVDLPEIEIVSERLGTVTAIRHWFDGKRWQNRVTESRDGGSHWIDLAILRERDAARGLIYASGPGRTRILLVHDYHTGSIRRSFDSGRSWEQLKFVIDGQSPAEWCRRLDSTPGVELVPHVAAVSPKDALTLYATFQLRIPQRRNPSGHGSWMDAPGMYVSHDGGDNWNLFSRELETRSPLGIGGEGFDVFVGMREDGLAESHDGGRSWTAMSTPPFFKQRAEIEGRRAGLTEMKARGIHVPNEALGPTVSIHQIELSPGDNPIIYLRTNVGLMISRDGGRTWCVAGAGNQVFDEMNGLSVSKTKPAEVLISTTFTSKSPSRILRSSDGGCTFKVLYTMD